MPEEQPDEPERKEGRAKKAGAGGWNWLKSKQANKALLSTIASAVVGGLAVAGIVVPLNDVERRVGVVESRFDGVLDRLDAVDSALSSIQSADPVGAVSSLAPQVKDLAGQVGLIRADLGTSPTSAAPTPASAATLVTTATPPAADRTVAASLSAAEAKLTELAASLATEQSTTRSLSASVAAIRSDLTAARTDVAAAQTAAAAAQAAVVALTGRVADLEGRLATLEAKQRTVQFGESAVAGPTNGAFATLSTVTVRRGRTFARWEWFHAPANGNCVAQVRIVDANDTPISTATLIGDGHPNAGIYSLHATWDAGEGGTFRLQTAVSGNVICTSNRVFAEVESTG